MSRPLTTAAVLLLLAGLVAVAVLWRDDDAPVEPADSPPTAPDTAPDTADDEGTAPATGGFRTVQPMTEPKVADKPHLLELPDGTFVPTLNGAVDVAPLADYWGPHPFSPIIGVKSSDGVDWYEHADGAFSTTVMVWREDLGRRAAMTRVGRPGPPPPPIKR